MTVGFAKVSIKGEGDSVGCVVSLSPHPVDSRLRGNDGPGRHTGFKAVSTGANTVILA